MKFKKIALLTTASAMIVSSMSVCAEEINGNLNYVDKTVYQLTLPTTTGMSFTLDPQGLTSLEEGEYDDSDAGKITASGVMTAENKSSVAVKLVANYYLADSTDGTPVSLKGSGEDVTDTNKEIQLTITADDDDTTVTYVKGTSSTDTTAETYEMDAATYKFQKNVSGEYEYVYDKDGDTINLTIGGKIAKDYDWSDYTGADADTLTLGVVFKFTDADDVDIPVIVDAAPSIPSTATYDCTEGEGTITVNLGSGSQVTTISKVYYSGNSANVANELTYSESSGIITYTVSNWSTQAGSTKYIKVVLADGTEQVIAVTLQ